MVENSFHLFYFGTTKERVGFFTNWQDLRFTASEVVRKSKEATVEQNASHTRTELLCYCQFCYRNHSENDFPRLYL